MNALQKWLKVAWRYGKGRSKNCRNIAWATVVVGAKLFNGLLWSDAVKEIEISFMNLENQICIFLSRVCSIHCALSTPDPLILTQNDPQI